MEAPAEHLLALKGVINWSYIRFGLFSRFDLSNYSNLEKSFIIWLLLIREYFQTDHTNFNTLQFLTVVMRLTKPSLYMAIPVATEKHNLPGEYWHF